MKFILTVAGSRAGLEFFHSLLDGHSQILQFPGVLRGNIKLKELLHLENPDEISQKFISDYKHFFDSRYYNPGDSASLDRHDQLGDERNEYYKVSKKKFLIQFKNLSKKRKSTNIMINNLINLHKAYALSCGYNIKKKKIIIINTHLIEYLKFYDKYIFKKKNFEIIHTIRHPLSALSSPLRWLKFNHGKDFIPNSIYFHINLVVNGIKNLKELKKKIKIIRLEDLHLKNKYTLKMFCNEYKIKYEKTLQKSTYNGLKWWGDKISKKNLNGVNKNFKISFDNKNFYNKDLIFFQKTLQSYLRKYSYDNIFKLEEGNDFFNGILPFKCEIMTWKNTIKNMKIKHIFSIPYFYSKRIFKVNFQKNSLALPNYVGE